MERVVMTAGIVIPFYQKETGILSRCLQSISAQTFDGKVLLVIVDDSSPLPAQQEVELTSFPDNIEVVILQQDNAGPGIARNKGIDYLVSRGVSFIALLDSDDVWTPDHLTRATLSFTAGADIYSCNWILTSGVDAFCDRNVNQAQLEKHNLIPEGGFLKKCLVEQECATSTIKLSAFVVTTKFLQKTRFDRRLRYACEDRLFILTLATKKPKVFLSLVPEVMAGRGVNIYESVEYGSIKNFNTLRDKLNGRIKMKKLLENSFPRLANSLDEQIQRTYVNCATNLYSCLKKKELSAIKSFLSIAFKRPTCFVYVFSVPLSRVVMALKASFG